jgi:hypothetical protein
MNMFPIFKCGHGIFFFRIAGVSYGHAIYTVILKSLLHIYDKLRVPVYLLAPIPSWKAVSMGAPITRTSILPWKHKALPT